MYGLYDVMKINSDMLVVLVLCIVFVIPECSPQLKPVVGQKFQSLDFAFAFYDVYVRVVGFDTCKQGMWRRMVLLLGILSYAIGRAARDRTRKTK